MENEDKYEYHEPVQPPINPPYELSTCMKNMKLEDSAKSTDDSKTSENLNFTADQKPSENPNSTDDPKTSENPTSTYTFSKKEIDVIFRVGQPFEDVNERIKNMWASKVQEKFLDFIENRKMKEFTKEDMLKEASHSIKLFEYFAKTKNKSDTSHRVSFFKEFEGLVEHGNKLGPETLCECYKGDK